MASTTALFTGLSGLISNSRRLDVIGNNISKIIIRSIVTCFFEILIRCSMK